jgi:hypothetical protein
VLGLEVLSLHDALQFIHERGAYNTYEAPSSPSAEQFKKLFDTLTKERVALTIVQPRSS